MFCTSCRCAVLKIIHDFNDPRRVDDDGRLILLRPDENKSERDELVEGMHVIIDGDTFEYEAVLELVEQFISDGLVDTWRARVVPGSFRYSDSEADAKRSERLWDIIRIGDFYAVRPVRSEEKGRWDTANRALREWVEGELSEVATQIERVQVSRDSPEDRDGESGHARLQLSTRVVGQLP